jgi:hypothetical protein
MIAQKVRGAIRRKLFPAGEDIGFLSEVPRRTESGVRPRCARDTDLATQISANT